MAGRIEDYALIGNQRTGALVRCDGSIDWLCLPHFADGAPFAALLGTDDHGCWRLGPVHAATSERTYREQSLVLETTHATASGRVRVTDFMPLGRGSPTVVRIVEGLDGAVDIEVELKARFGYGDLPPWTRWIGDACTMTAVGDALALRTDAPLEIVGHDPRGHFEIRAGQRISFVLEWYPAYRDVPPATDAQEMLTTTLDAWRAWCGKIAYRGPHADQLQRSLITLKALTDFPVGASVAAVTTSLPEELGGSKNWDYRYAWVRDSTFVISALLNCGLVDEARAWRDWVLRALAGRPENMQIMYGLRGARRIDEYELALPGYQGAQPVRIGNAAYRQFQLGIYGETMSAIGHAHESGVEIDEPAWDMLTLLLEHVESVWDQPDAGIWESRSEPRHYTHSKVQAWRAFHVGVQLVEHGGYRGPLERWRRLEAQIRDDVCTHGFHSGRGVFTQSYGSSELDAAALLMSITGFLPADDPRMRATIEAIERDLMCDGFVYRTSNDPETGAHQRPGEGAFLACNCWMIENYVMLGRFEDAQALLERVLGIANDVGLLSEEYDPQRQRLVGNFPQTFSHASLVNAICRLADRDRSHERKPGSSASLSG